MKIPAAATIAVALMITYGPANAGTVYVCKQAGTTDKVFQDKPCPAGRAAGTLRTADPGSPEVTTAKKYDSPPQYAPIVAKELREGLVTIGKGAIQEVPKTFEALKREADR